MTEENKIAKCEWCEKPATRKSHDGCLFCEEHSFGADMLLPGVTVPSKPEENKSKTPIIDAALAIANNFGEFYGSDGDGVTAQEAHDNMVSALMHEGIKLELNLSTANASNLEQRKQIQELEWQLKNALSYGAEISGKLMLRQKEIAELERKLADCLQLKGL